jgi:hypothetical protein
MHNLSREREFAQWDKFLFSGNIFFVGWAFHPNRYDKERLN